MRRGRCRCRSSYWTAATLAFALTLSLAGCAWLWPEIPATGDIAVSARSRDTDPAVAADDLSALLAANSGFAFDLLHEFGSEDGNLVYSPLSISAALAMVFAGARGETEEQMADVLGFDLGQDVVHAGFNRLDLELSSRATVEPPHEGEGFDLSVVNAAWGQLGYTYLRSYLDILAIHYGAGVRLLDFAATPEAARETINDWVEEETNDRIVDLLPPGSISPAARLVLTNAVTFNAPWLKPFDANRTAPGSFETQGGATAAVPMMEQAARLGHTAWDGGQAVELPYNGQTLSMLFLVPDRGLYEDFEAGLDLAQYRAIVDTLTPQQVVLRLPTFEIASTVPLAQALQRLGMVDAFAPGVADLSGIDGKLNLFIADALHQGWISVDEAGTEAAAATAIVIEPTSEPGAPIVLTIDRPFLFVIRDLPTGTILFVGRVLDPSAASSAA